MPYCIGLAAIGSCNISSLHFTDFVIAGTFLCQPDAMHILCIVNTAQSCKRIVVSRMQIYISSACEECTNVTSIFVTLA